MKTLGSNGSWWSSHFNPVRQSRGLAYLRRYLMKTLGSNGSWWSSHFNPVRQSRGLASLRRYLVFEILIQVSSMEPLGVLMTKEMVS